MNNLTTEIGYYSVNKYGEQLCGDNVRIIELEDENSTVIVLADGLGSGVKANILSTLTSTIISTMMASNMPLEECVATIASTLPICEVRKLAYSTFTILRIINNEEAEIINFDNPQVILLRNGLSRAYPETALEIGGKTIYKSHISLMKDDVFILMSDGAIHAGVGQSLNLGWTRKNIVKFMEENFEKDRSAKSTATMLLDKCNQLYSFKPGDDTTVCAVKIRERKPVNLMIGPPVDPNNDRKMLSIFLGKDGKRIVCGGTTSNIVAKFLGKEIEVDLDSLSPDIPPMAKIEGIDLVTEGVITFAKVVEYAKDYLDDNEFYYEWNYRHDGASKIAKVLFEEATDINFFVGRAINPAHQNPELPITFNIKMQLVEELSKCLEKMNKKIKVSYF